jgi:hypothetical protein
VFAFGTCLPKNVRHATYTGSGLRRAPALPLTRYGLLWMRRSRDNRG